MRVTVSGVLTCSATSRAVVSLPTHLHASLRPTPPTGNVRRPLRAPSRAPPPRPLHHHQQPRRLRTGPGSWPKAILANLAPGRLANGAQQLVTDGYSTKTPARATTKNPFDVTRINTKRLIEAPSKRGSQTDAIDSVDWCCAAVRSTPRAASAGPCALTPADQCSSHWAP